MVRFYYKDKPDVGDLLVCRIESIDTDGGYLVELLEYDNIIAFVGLKEITQAKWLRNLRNIASEGDVEVMEVISIGDKGEVSLSRRYISEEAKEDAFTRYRRWKRVYDYLFYMVSHDHRDYIVNEILYPYLRHVDNFAELNGDVEDDDGDKPKPAISKWVEERKTLLEDVSIYDALLHVVQLMEKPTEIKRQNGTIQLRPLARLRVQDVNRILPMVATDCKVHIQTFNTKNATFQVSSKEKMSLEQFNDVLATILERTAFHVDQLEKKSKTQSLGSSESSESLESSESADVATRQPILNIGIVGHVAHGKTTLIEAISGVDTRKYKKEIASNRTLNIGYTNTTLCKCVCNRVPMYLAEKDIPSGCSCDRVSVSIVDCPGHNVLLSTMITGAQIMDMCILVIAANEFCPQPQTNEHVAVLQIIGSNSPSRQRFSDGLVLQNKVDLVPLERAKVSFSEIEKFTAGTIFEGLNVIPVSAQMRINTETVIGFIYESAKRKLRERSEQRIENAEQDAIVGVGTNPNKGIIVRTFDINKPGSERICGAVVGGSIMDGKFSVGENIMILPLAIKATILSMKTDNRHLQTAHPGGLIALQTDINPTYCSLLVGCTFIKEKDFQPERLLSEETALRFKYSFLQDFGTKYLQKGEKLLINYSGSNIEATVVKSSREHHRATMRLAKPMYVFPEEKPTFTLICNKRLAGYGWAVDYVSASCTKDTHSFSSDTDRVVESVVAYEDMLANFSSRLQEWKESSMAKVKIPVPKTLYRNTFTTIVNFGNIADALTVSTEELGLYVYHELGCKSWSVNGLRQLILKGRTDERKVMSVLQHFVVERRCMLCRRNTVKTVRNMGVKQRVCTNCSWKN